MPFANYSSTKKDSSRWGSPSDDPNDTTSVEKQIANANTRISDAGYTPRDTDTRNSFEKLTNLPQHQNAFLDTLELFGRGGNAVKNVIDKTLVHTDESVGKALYNGISGREKVNGADIVGNMGVKNKVAKFVLGTALDIGTDPTSYIPAGVIAKGIGASLKPIGGLAKVGYKVAESASPALKTLRQTKLEPAFNSTKDALGRAFVPQYKWDETLTGGSDNTLKDLFRETNNSTSFMNENALDRIGRVAKTTGIDAGADVGRLMEKDVVANGPRPARTLSTDPIHLKATQDLVDSNKELRQWATDNDIPIGEIDGYMRHIWSEEERALRKNPKAIDRVTPSLVNPDKKILEKRKYSGSAEDVNDEVGRNMFETNAYFATAIGQKKLIEYGNAVKFRREILSNPDFAKPYKLGDDVPEHQELIDSNNYKFMKNPNNALPDKIGGQYVVTKGVKEALDRYQGLATDEGTKGMIKAFDATQNFWKKMALFSPGFHVRNAMGAMFNNTVAGMNPVHLIKYTKEAGSEVIDALKGKESPLYREFRSEGLGSSGISKVEYAKMGEAPEQGVIKTVENMSKTGLDRAVGAVKSPLESSRKAGDISDQVSRFALYKWARETKGMNAKDAAKKVREVQYDYTELTPFERNVMKRAMPFYTWSRKNIPFQLKSFINDPRVYSGVNKIRLNSQSANNIDEKSTPDFMKENFAIPLNRKNMLGLNLPLSDLTKLSHPLKTITDLVSPIPKTIAEESLNYNFFKGKPIEKFAGENKKYLGGLAIPAKLDYAIKAATGQIGRGLGGFLGDDSNTDLDNKFRTPSMGINSIVKPYDAEKSIKFQKLQELKDLQDYINYITQQTGERPKTIAQIKKGSSRWD